MGDSSKARKRLGWEPKVKFEELVKIMVEADMDLAKREAHMNNFIDTESKVQGMAK